MLENENYRGAVTPEEVLKTWRVNKTLVSSIGVRLICNLLAEKLLWGNYFSASPFLFIFLYPEDTTVLVLTHDSLSKLYISALSPGFDST